VTSPLSVCCAVDQRNPHDVCRLRGDLIEVFKIFKGFDNIKYTQFFTMSDTGLRGHKLKIYKPQVHLDIRKYFFSIRVIEEWNSLPVVLINCNTVASFNKRIDCYFRNRGYTSSHSASFLVIATFGWLVELS